MSICSKIRFKIKNVYYLKLKRESDLPHPKKYPMKQTIISFVLFHFSFPVIWIVTVIEQLYQNAGSFRCIDQYIFNCPE